MPKKAKNTKNTKSNIIPTLRYDNAAVAIEWLCKAFGFEKRLVIPDEDGRIVHAQLTFGNGMIMCSSAHDSEYDNLIKPPISTAGIGTQSPYIVVADADEHYARAVAAGAKIAVEIDDQEHGGRLYSCFDPEGHLWNFGTYDPWTSE